MNYKIIKNENILEKTTFENVCKVQQGLQIEIKERLKKQENNSHLYITIQHLKTKENPEYILNPRSTVICNKNDILVARTGSTGKIVKGVEGVFHNNFFKLNLKEGYSSDFLYYVLTSDEIQEKIKIVTGVTTIPDLNHGDFYSLVLYPFSLIEQKDIAKILLKQETILSNIKKLIEKNELIFNEISDQLLSGNLRVKEENGEIIICKNPDDNWTEVEINDETKKIPTDWGKNKIRDFFNSYIGGEYGEEKKFDNSIETEVFTLYVFNKNKSEKSKVTRYIKNTKLKNRILESGDILLEKSGGTVDMPVGRIYQFNQIDKKIYSAVNFINILKISDKNNKEFVFKLLSYFYNLGLTKKYEQRTTNIANLKVEEFLNHEVPFTTNLIEQRLILSILNKHENNIEKQKQLFLKEKEKFEWLLDNLLSGNYLVKEIEK